MTPERINEELKRISARVPKGLLKRVTFEEKLTPDIEFVVKESLKGEMDPMLRKQAEDLLEKGEFSKTKLRTNPKIEKMLDEWYSREINKAVKEGRLPRKVSLKDPFLKKMYENQKGDNGGN